MNVGWVFRPLISRFGHTKPQNKVGLCKMCVCVWGGGGMHAGW